MNRLIRIWFGITWSLELYQQTVARLWRQGQTEGTVSVIHIVTDGTVDERILKAFWDRSNWQPLCEHHHNVKTMTEDRFKEYRF